MKEAMEKAIKELTEKAMKASDPNSAAEYSQAALNIAHALQVVL